MSFFTKYRFNRFLLQSEYIRTNGYLTADNSGEGWYIHSSCFLTDKLQLLTRFDTFDASSSVSRNGVSEYTVGLNYYLNGKPVNNTKAAFGNCSPYIKGNTVKFQINYVYVDDRTGKNSNKVIAQTQYLL